MLVAADLGADVIKVEAPRTGDGVRSFAPPSFGDDATYYLSVNRNRRSIVVDLATPEGRSPPWRRSPRAPTPSSRTSCRTSSSTLGLAALREELDDVVWVSVRGAASTGPARRRPVVRPARPGAIRADVGDRARPTARRRRSARPSPTSSRGSTPPRRCLAGLYARAAGGAPRTLRGPAARGDGRPRSSTRRRATSSRGEDPGRLGNDHPSIAPYGPGRDRATATSSSRPRRRRSSVALCEALGDVALADDPRFATNASRVEHRAALDEALRRRLRGARPRPSGPPRSSTPEYRAGRCTPWRRRSRTPRCAAAGS